MEIQNSTSDDTIIKVEGGPGKSPKGPKKKAVQFCLKAGQVWKDEDQKPGSLPASPWTVHFYARVTNTDVQPNAPTKKLTLTKMSNNGYRLRKT